MHEQMVCAMVSGSTNYVFDSFDNSAPFSRLCRSLLVEEATFEAGKIFFRILALDPSQQR